MTAGAAATIAVALVLADAPGRARAAVRRFRSSSSPSVRLYDAAASAALAPYYRMIARECVEALAGRREPEVLEIGPGPGHLAELLLEAVPGLRWTGLDVDAAMLEATRVRVARRDMLARATFIEGDVAAIPLATGFFDLVVSSLSAHHWPDPIAGFREIERVLRREGTARIYDLPGRWGRLETGSLGIEAAREAWPDARLGRAAGVGPLTLVVRADLPPRPLRATPAARGGW